MGLLDFLFGGSKESQFKRHAKRITNLNAQAEDREASAEWLAQEGSPQAIASLLKRFTLNYEQRMKDTREKERIHSLLEGIGEDVVEPAKEWMRKNDNFAYPIRLIQKFEGEDKTITFLLELLSLENDDFAPNKKIQLLSHLQNFKHKAIAQDLPKYLNDFNEDVRFATIQALANQKDPDSKVPLLEQMSQEASNRLRDCIAALFVDENWSIAPHQDLIREKIPVSFTIDGDYLKRK